MFQCGLEWIKEIILCHMEACLQEAPMATESDAKELLGNIWEWTPHSTVLDAKDLI
jgi:hypothetical protein